MAAAAPAAAATAAAAADFGADSSVGRALD